MQVPEDVGFPAMERLEAQGVSFDRQYCTVPICTPSRATMWTGVHAEHTGLWDNTNFAWIDELSSDDTDHRAHAARAGLLHGLQGQVAPVRAAAQRGRARTLRLLRLPAVGRDVRRAAARRASSTAPSPSRRWTGWSTKRTTLDQPWLLVCSLVNPHDIMFFRTDPVEKPHPDGSIAGLQDDRAAAGLVRAAVGRRTARQLRRRLQAPAVRRAALQGVVDLNYGQHPRRSRPTSGSSAATT